MRMVACRTLFNETKLVPAEMMMQRPSAYGVIVHQSQLLVILTRHTHKYALPGGHIEKGEENEAALVREIKEETGIDAKVESFAHFMTDFFYYDPLDFAIHGFLFFYYCQPITVELPTIEYPPEEDDIEKALWVNIRDLNNQSFETRGDLIMHMIAQSKL
jgi:8-oxo-dGTP pyrophosphatase MutT (NUDIX family)